MLVFVVHVGELAVVLGVIKDVVGDKADQMTLGTMPLHLTLVSHLF